MADRRRSDASSGRTLPPFRADARCRDKARLALAAVLGLPAEDIRVRDRAD